MIIMKTRCLLVDDEPLALEVLEAYVSKLEDFEIVAKCTNAIKASELLRTGRVDLMFLDIKMPQFDGISFLKSLQNPPKVVFTTAYRDFALDGYELNVVDYLLKPISFERFMKAVNRYHELIREGRGEIHETTTQQKDRYIYVKSDKKMVKILFKDILFIESMEDYIVIHRRDSKIITKDRISRLEEILPPEMFVRIHRSYIVSIPRIEAITSETVEIGKKELPVGRSYKLAVLRVLEGKG
jgi:DNA-binding LytR/AlgR family response regulator